MIYAKVITLDGGYEYEEEKKSLEKIAGLKFEEMWIGQ